MANEPVTGADKNGYDPFPGALHYPGADSVPGPLSKWRPLYTTGQYAYDYAGSRFAFLRDRSLLNLLISNRVWGD